MAHNHRAVIGPKVLVQSLCLKPPASETTPPQNLPSHATAMPLRDNIIPTSRPSNRAEASLLGAKVGVPAEATDVVPLVDVWTGEGVVSDAPD